MIFHIIQVWVSVTMSVFYLLFHAVQIWFHLATPSLTGDSNGNKIESDTSKATIFKQFFAGVFVHEGCSNLPSFTIDCSVPSLCEADVSPTVIYSKLRLLNGCKSPYPDGWPTVALKECAVEISTLLSIVLPSHFNLVFYLSTH